jgi:hypothetical protein
MKFCPSSPGKGGGLEERERERERRKQGGKIFKKSHKGILSGKLTDRSTCLPIPDAVLSFRSLNSFLELHNNLDND